MNALNRDLDLWSQDPRAAGKAGPDADGFVDERPARRAPPRPPGPWRLSVAFLLALGALGATAALVYPLAPGGDLRALAPAMQMAAGAGGGLVALLILFVGFVAHEGAKARHSGQLMTLAARRLLAPAANSAAEIKELGAVVRAQTSAFDQAIRAAQERLAGLEHSFAEQISAIARASSAAQTQADSLRASLEGERTALAQLGESLAAQSQMAAQAVAKSARMASDAAGLGEQEMIRAEQILRERQREIDASLTALRAKSEDIVKSANEALARSQALEQWLVRTEDRVANAGKAAETARGSAELALAAAEGAARSLQSLVGDTLENARKAAEFVDSRANAAHLDAAGEFEQLRSRAAAAESAVDSARIAIERYANDAQDKLRAVATAFADATAKAEQAAEERFHQATRIMEQAAVALGVTADRVESHAADPAAATSPAKPQFVDIGRAAAAPPTPQVFAPPGYTPPPSPAPETRPNPEPRPIPEPRPAARLTAESGPQSGNPVPAADPAPSWTHFFGAPVAGPERGPAERNRPSEPPRPAPSAPFSAPEPPRRTASTPPAAAKEENAREGFERSLDPLDDGDPFSQPFRPDNRPNTPAPRRPGPSEPAAGLSWKDLLASIDEDANAGGEAQRARQIVEDLGVRPLHVFRGVDLDRILAKARTGASARRRAVREIAGEWVRKVEKKLEREEKLAAQARRFVDGFAPQFAGALHTSGENGTILSLVNSEEGRLFLLLDAATE